MNRCHDTIIAECVGLALARLPSSVRALIGQPDFLIGIDPIFSGLYHHKHQASDITHDGRLYSNTGHTYYPEPVPRINPVIVLPSTEITFHRRYRYQYGITAILHELGHVLESRFHLYNFPVPVFKPVSDYATANHHEAFACAFQAWFEPVEMVDQSHIHGSYDEGSRAFFDKYFA